MPADQPEAYQPAEPLRYPIIDERSALHAIRDTHGERQVQYGDLLAQTHRWPVSSTAPEGVSALLSTSRQTFALAMYHYELFTVASVWSLMAVEAALRHHYSARGSKTLAALIKRAGKDGLLDESWVERLDAGRQLRNGLIHVETTTVFNPAISGSILEASHEVVAAIFSDRTRPR